MFSFAAFWPSVFFGKRSATRNLSSSDWRWARRSMFRDSSASECLVNSTIWNDEWEPLHLVLNPCDSNTFNHVFHESQNLELGTINQSSWGTIHKVCLGEAQDGLEGQDFDWRTGTQPKVEAFPLTTWNKRGQLGKKTKDGIDTKSPRDSRNYLPHVIWWTSLLLLLRSVALQFWNLKTFKSRMEDRISREQQWGHTIQRGWCGNGRLLLSHTTQHLPCSKRIPREKDVE